MDNIEKLKIFLVESGELERKNKLVWEKNVSDIKKNMHQILDNVDLCDLFSRAVIGKLQNDYGNNSIDLNELSDTLSIPFEGLDTIGYFAKWEFEDILKGVIDSWKTLSNKDVELNKKCQLCKLLLKFGKIGTYKKICKNDVKA